MLVSLWTNALVYVCLLEKRTMKIHTGFIKFRSLIRFFGTTIKMSPPTITALMGSHQLTLCRWTEMHPGHTILALSWNTFSSLNKHCGKQLWPQPITINQHNYVKNVFEIWRSNGMSLCAWTTASSLSSDAEMKLYKVDVWEDFSEDMFNNLAFLNSWYAFPATDIQK